MMRNFIRKLIVLLGFAFIIYAAFLSLSPQISEKKEPLPSGFSIANAQRHVTQIAQEPHSVGTAAHSSVRNYIVQELQQLGLQVQTQKDYFLSKEGTFTAPENIITKIEGSNPQPKSDLLLLTHYDSAVHSSLGASDAGSGVATLLEGLRVFLQEHQQPQNNIIICFTDAEEIGLNGAGLFAKQHPWSNQVGLVLNFEARGSGGPSNTILETNAGNKKLIQAFDEAQPRFPNATSLMYSVYKILPNDTDATVFREEKDIPSFFFAFIDDHFDYHTAKDTPKNLNPSSLAHQATYLMACLPYFGNTNLADLKDTREVVYFNVPITHSFIHYDYGWILPLLIIAWLAFMACIAYGIRKKLISGKAILRGFATFLAALIVSGLVSYFGWQLLYKSYWQYQENLNGFTPNGHWYIAACICFSLSCCWFAYAKLSSPKKQTPQANALVAPIFIWLIINTGIAFFLKGAAYFIIPLYFAIASFFISLKSAKPLILVHATLAIPALLLLVPLLQFFPVGLGLKMLVITAVLAVLIIGLMLPVLQAYRHKKYLGSLGLVLMLACIWIAHSKADFSKEQPKPNSLIYQLNVPEQSASWNTYDQRLDDWTAPFLNDNDTVSTSNTIFHSKYNNTYTQRAVAPVKAIPSADFWVYKDSTAADFNRFTVKISPQRSINRMELFADQAIDFDSLSANGKTAPKLHQAKSGYFYNNRTSDRLLTYYAIDQDTLQLQFNLPKKTFPSLHLYEASNDLLNNPWVKVPQRSAAMMPKPFVLNDALVTYQIISLAPKK